MKDRKHGIPIIGNTAKEIWQAWVKLARNPFPGRMVVALVSGEGMFGMDCDSKLTHMTLHRVPVGKNYDETPCVTPATEAQDIEVWRAFENGTVQIEDRPVYYRCEPTKVLHQATGTPPEPEPEES